MRLIETRVERSAGEVRLVGVVERTGGRGPIEMFFSYPEGLADWVRDVPDPFVPALLVPSLKTGEDLEIVPPMSPRLRRQLSRVQDILVAWHPFRRIRIDARDRSGAEPSGTAVGALFSSGVDSFYTLLKSLRGWPAETPPISHLLFLRGLETPLDIAAGVDESQRQVEEIAREVGLVLIVGHSNVRTHFSLNYELYYQSAALSAAALALSGGLRYLLIPSSNSYAQLRPWGSDPLLDPLWSTEALEIVHDGSEARRVDKLQTLVARDPLALKYLRVCLENSGGAFNCGKCRKCIRTMVALDLLDVLPHAPTFPNRLPDVAELRLRQDADETEKHPNELLDLASRVDGHLDLKRLLGRVARRRRRRRAIRTIVENTPGLDAVLPWLDRVRRAIRRRLGLPGGESPRPALRPS